MSLAAWPGGDLRSPRFTGLKPLKSACSWERAWCCRGKRSAAEAEAAQQQRGIPRRVALFLPIYPSPGLGAASATPDLILLVSQVLGGSRGELRGEGPRREQTASREPISLLPSPQGPGLGAASPAPGSRYACLQVSLRPGGGLALMGCPTEPVYFLPW